MTDRIWIGGGDNQASNPLDWSPTGVPHPGDSLLVSNFPPYVTPPYTMNVSGNDLAGDSIFLNTASTFTANLSHQAAMTLQDRESGGIFNLSQNSALVISTDRTIATVNISGNDVAHLTAEDDGGFTVNLAQGARWSGTFAAAPGFHAGFDVSGGSNSTFNNNGSSAVNDGIVAMGVDVTGNGRISVASGNIEFMKSVEKNQSIVSGGRVQIDQPSQFAASTTLQASGEFDLEGLAKADSYTFKNDMLSIFGGNKVIDTLRLHDSTPFGFGVIKTAGSVNIVAITDSMNPPIGLAIHT